MPCPTPVIGERIIVIYPEGYPEKASTPYPVFRALLSGVLGYAFVMLGMAITEWW